jgi:hypothetical protein
MYSFRKEQKVHVPDDRIIAKYFARYIWKDMINAQNSGNIQQVKDLNTIFTNYKKEMENKFGGEDLDTVKTYIETTEHEKPLFYFFSYGGDTLDIIEAVRVFDRENESYRGNPKLSELFKGMFESELGFTDRQIEDAREAREILEVSSKNPHVMRTIPTIGAHNMNRKIMRMEIENEILGTNV